MRHLYIVLALLLLSSCMSTEKATGYLKKKGALAGLCAEEYPVRESYKPGKPVIVRDTVEKEGKVMECPETIDKATGKAYRPKVQCPPQKVVRETVSRTDIIYQENTALVKAQAQELQGLKEKLRIAEEQAAGRLIWVLVLTGLLVLVLLRWYKHLA